MEVQGEIFIAVAPTVGGSKERQRMDMNACEVNQMPPNNTVGRMVCQCKASAAAVCHARVDCISYEANFLFGSVKMIKHGF